MSTFLDASFAAFFLILESSFFVLDYNFSLVNSKSATNTNKRIIKAITVIAIVPPVLVAKIILIYLKHH